MSNNKKKSAIEYKRDYDILNMLNSISNFEVFTPFEVTQSMVSLLPEEVFKHPEYKFLDPCVKSGIFLREIVYKLDEHLPRIKYTDPDSKIEYDLENKKQRTSHILRNMIYGIAISELTAYVTRRTLYGVMEANADKIDEYLKSRIILNRDETASDDDLNAYYDCNIFNTKDRKGFENEGNIFYPDNETTIDNEDAHYPFINETNHKIIKKIKEEKMKFDIIIGNPPYQSSTSKINRQAKPLYHIFVNNAKKLNPKYISMIIPSRWFSGGMGMSSFRESMLNDSRIKILVDFPNSKDCFPNVNIAGGVCYFLWDERYNGLCNVVNKFKEREHSVKRKLNEYPVFIRNNFAISISEKIKKEKKMFLNSQVLQISPFGFPTNARGEKKSPDKKIKLFHSKGFGFVSLKDVLKNKDIIDKYKVTIGKAVPSNGEVDVTPEKGYMVTTKPIIYDKNEIVTASYLVIGSFDSKKEAENFSGFLKLKFTRFLLKQTMSSMNISKESFSLVPMLDWSLVWTDEKLYELFNLNKEEINHIESIIRIME